VAPIPSSHWISPVTDTARPARAMSIRPVISSETATQRLQRGVDAPRSLGCERVPGQATRARLGR
jgi:hypothetical protein